MKKAREMEADLAKKYGTGSKDVQSENKTSSKPAAKKSAAQMAADLYEKYSPEKVAQRQQNVYNWAQKYTSTMQGLSDFDTKRNGKYTKDVSGGYISQVEELIKEFADIEDYAGRNGIPNADRYYKELIRARDNILKQNQYIGSFENEDAYNRAMRRNQWADKYQGKSASELTAMVDSVTDEEEKEWLKGYSDSLGYQERMDYDLDAGREEVNAFADAYTQAQEWQRQYNQYLNNPLMALTDGEGFRRARDQVQQIQAKYGSLRGMEQELQKKRNFLMSAGQTQQQVKDAEAHEAWLKTLRPSEQIRPELEKAQKTVEELKPFRYTGGDALNQSLQGKLEAAEQELHGWKRNTATAGCRNSMHWQGMRTFPS